MLTPHRCIIDRNDIYKTNVVMTDHLTGVWLDEPHQRSLQDGEQLIEASPPSGLIRAKWSGTEWVEAATQAEIEEARLANEQQLAEIAKMEANAKHTPTEQLAAELTTAMAEMQQQNDMAVAELTTAIAGLGVKTDV